MNILMHEFEYRSDNSWVYIVTIKFIALSDHVSSRSYHSRTESEFNQNYRYLLCFS